MNNLSAVVGINWGDEGKGRMVDLLADRFDIVVRYQGGNNAGHTVINEKGKFILNLLPSGILRENTVNVMGSGMVIDLAHLCGEIKKLRDAGISITPENLKISDKAIICMPYHVMQDCLEEDRLAGKKFGSTRRGIAPVYADKYLKKAIRTGDLFERKALEEHLKDVVEWKNLTVEGAYHAEKITAEAMSAWLDEYGVPLMPFICDTGKYLDNAIKAGKRVTFEAQLGALRDIDFGIYPFTSSSSTIAAYAPVGAGIPQYTLTEVVGIMKAYSTCVGEGPFTVEMTGDEAHALREAGGEYGAATGRPRRVGAFDAVASAYGVRVQGATCIALTKLDVLSYMKKIPVCVSYTVDGVETKDFPVGAKLDRATANYIYLDGWNCDISHVREEKDMPEKLAEYISFIEKAVGCKVRYASVGAERDEYVCLK